MAIDLTNSDSNYKRESINWKVEFLRKKFDHILSEDFNSNNLELIINQSNWYAHNIILDLIKNDDIRKYVEDNVCLNLEYMDRHKVYEDFIIKNVYESLLELEKKV